MFEDYKKKQEELDNEEKRAQQEYDAATESLSDYNKDLEVLIAKFTADKKALKVKHDYNNKNEIFARASERLYDTQIAKRDAKILFILDAINTFLEHPFYEGSKYNAWAYLWNTYKIHRNENYYNFQEMYDLIETNGLDFVHVSYPHEYCDKYEISDYRYYRYDPETCSIEIPKKIVDNLDDFIKGIETKINVLESEMKNREEARQQERLKLYEQLKAEFGT